jgi:hypothetical protein
VPQADAEKQPILVDAIPPEGRYVKGISDKRVGKD